MTTETLTAAIENAKIRQQELVAQFGDAANNHHASGEVETTLGAVTVHFVVAAGRIKQKPEQMRQTWKLNGKRISRDKLVAALRGV